MVQAFWLLPLTWHSRSHEIAIGYIEEMERQYTSSIAARRFFSIHPSESVGYRGRYASVGLQSKKHFRTINVQWIGQWGLSSPCGIS